MNDRAVDLLSQYDLEVLHIKKGRGSILCDTDRGCFVFKEYKGSEEHAGLQNILLQTIINKGCVEVEQIIPDREGRLLVKDADETAYVLKTRCDGRELVVNDMRECIQAAGLLARLHQSMEVPSDTPGLQEICSPGREYEKHNREIKKVKKYLRQKSQKQPFERKLLASCDFFLEQAIGVTEEWSEYSRLTGRQDSVPDEGRCIPLCHGDYQYHNILTNDRGWFIVNFEKCVVDNPIRDLYLFMRKLMEKTNWSVELGKEIMQAYEEQRELSLQDRIDLYYRLAYPEKFWKIANFYFNAGKAWIPGKNREKLDKIIEQEKYKQLFLDQVFRSV